MPISRALVVLLCGVVMLIGSCVPLGSALYQAVNTKPVSALSMGDDGRLQTTRLELTPDRSARIVADVEVHTTSVQEGREGGDAGHYARYRFPLRYRVADSGGGELADVATTIDWRDKASDFSGREREASLLERESRVTADGGSVRARAVFRVFDVPQDGIVNVSAEIGEDSTYGAEARAVEIEVEHAIDNPTTRIVLGVFLLMAGFIVTVVGFVLVVARPIAHAPIDENVSGDRAASIRQLAMFGHLAGLLGFVIPFASVLAPLVLWLLNRSRHPYIDEQGREAINFQLTILVYLLLAFALVLALVGLVLIPLIVLFQLIMVLVAAVRVNDGEAWRYPVTLRFLR
ncbi:MAG: DUF4870 domain-containing protein [Gammaproteobacteria bacterium]